MTGTQDTTVVTRFYDQVDCLRVRRLTGPTVNVVGGSHGQKITDRGYVLRTYGGVGFLLPTSIMGESPSSSLPLDPLRVSIPSRE